jgi:hypothetical protein
VQVQYSEIHNVYGESIVRKDKGFVIKTTITTAKKKVNTMRKGGVFHYLK